MSWMRKAAGLFQMKRRTSGHHQGETKDYAEHRFLHNSDANEQLSRIAFKKITNALRFSNIITYRWLGGDFQTRSRHVQASGGHEDQRPAGRCSGSVQGPAYWAHSQLVLAPRKVTLVDRD